MAHSGSFSLGSRGLATPRKNLNRPSGQKVGSTMSSQGHPELRLAFRFVKLCVCAEDNAMPMPTWEGFDQYDTFDSRIVGDVIRTAHTPDGDSEVTLTVNYRLGNDIVATVFLKGLRTPWDTAWNVTRVIYASAWDSHNGRGPMYDFDVDTATATYTDRAMVAA